MSSESLPMTPANQHTGIERLSDERLRKFIADARIWLDSRYDNAKPGWMVAQLPAIEAALSLRAYAEQQEPVSDFERQIHEAIISRLVSLTVGSCSCSTMTPELKRHTENCRYRIAAEALELARPLYAHPLSSSAVDGVTDRMVNAALLEFNSSKHTYHTEAMRAALTVALAGGTNGRE